MNLLSGPAGSGKSLFAYQYLYHGAQEEDQLVLCVSMEEDRVSVLRSTSDFFPNFGALSRKGKILIIDLGEIRTEEPSGSVSFRDIQSFLSTYLTKNPAQRIVVDSISAIGLHYESLDKVRTDLFRFFRFLRTQPATSLLISESIEGKELTRFGVEQFLADSFTVVGLEEIKGELRRTLTVRKMRFTQHDTAKHPFHISPDGVEVFVTEKVL